MKSYATHVEVARRAEFDKFTRGPDYMRRARHGRRLAPARLRMRLSLYAEVSLYGFPIMREKWNLNRKSRSRRWRARRAVLLSGQK